MTDRSILFSAPMVLALIAGRKTQTRRTLNPQPYPLEGRPGFWNASGAVGGRICVSDRALLDLHKKAKLGDRLYVREHWRTESRAYDDLAPSDMGGEETILYNADADWSLNKSVGRFRQGRHMPRWASRLTLIVEDVKIERLQDISNEDCIAEGVDRLDSELVSCFSEHRDGRMTSSIEVRTYAPAYQKIWESINGASSWAANPWVAAYTFRVIPQNIDQIGGAA